MKLLMTLSYYAPYISGLTICTQRIAEALAKRGHTVHVLTTQYEKHLKRNETRSDVRITRVSYLFKISKGFFMPLYSWYTLKLITRSDLVIINLPQFEGFIVAFIACLLRKRMYCIYHCEVSLSKRPFDWLMEKTLHAANTLSLVLSERVVTYTQDYARHSKLLEYFSKKLTFIYPPIPALEIDRKTVKKLKNKLSIHRRYVIGVAARIAREKGLEYLLEAIPFMKKRLVKDIIIVIAGPKNPVGEKAYWRELSPLLERHTHAIRFLGTLGSKEMGAFYSLIDVLVLPSVNSTEAFGVVQVEAMLCRTPVVASYLPGVRVPIKVTGMGELAKPRDSKDLASKIVKVLKYRRSYIKKREAIKKHFLFSRTISQYEKILTSIS